MGVDDGITVADEVWLGVLVWNNDRSLDAYATVIADCRACMKFVKVDVVVTVVDPALPIPTRTIGLGTLIVDVTEGPAVVLAAKFW